MLLSQTYSSDAGRLDYAKLLGLLAAYDNERGRSFIAREKSLRPLTTLQDMLPEDHPLVLERINSHGEILLDLGELQESRAFLQKATLGREKIFGMDDLKTLDSINGLAYLSMRLSDLDVAEELAQKALTGRTKLLGSEDVYTCDSLRILTLVRDSKGDCDNAVDIYREIIKKQSKVLGPEHKDVLITVNHLALALSNQGELDTAEDIFRSLLNSQRKMLGEDHQSTLISMHNVADMVYQKGNIDQGRKMFQELLEKRERCLGAEHIATLGTLDPLAEIAYEHDHDYSTAEKLFRRAAAGYEKVLGSDNPQTLMALYQLARTLIWLGDYEESEKLGRRVVSGNESVFGRDNHMTLKGLLNVALSIATHDPDRHEEVQMICQEVLQRSERQLREGIEEYRKIETRSLQILLYLFQKQGKQEEFEKIAERLSRLELQSDGDLADATVPSSCEEAATTSSQPADTVHL